MCTNVQFEIKIVNDLISSNEGSIMECHLVSFGIPLWRWNYLTKKTYVVRLHSP